MFDSRRSKIHFTREKQLLYGTVWNLTSTIERLSVPKQRESLRGSYQEHKSFRFMLHVVNAFEKTLTQYFYAGENRMYVYGC